jgi:hypothetical protein
LLVHQCYTSSSQGRGMGMKQNNRLEFGGDRGAERVM